MNQKIVYFFLTVCFFLHVSCEEDDMATSQGTGVVNFSLDNLQETENATASISIYIGVDTFKHAGGTVNVEITGGEYGTDYETSGDSGSFVVDIEAGSVVSSFSIIPLDNDVIAENKQLTITMTSASGSLEVGENNAIVFTILENDEPLPAFTTIDFTESSATIDEDGGTLIVEFLLSSETTSESTVKISTNASGTATAGEDFDINGDASGIYTLTIPSGATSASIDINIVDDEAIEDDETIVLDISGVTGSLELGTVTVQQTVNIVNNDVEAGVLAYLEDFESFDASETYLNDVLLYQNALVSQTVDPTSLISLINNGGNFSDADDVSSTSDNGLNLFYNSSEDPAKFGILDNVVITPILEGTGTIDVSIDAAYAFKNQNSGEITFYWSETYDGSGVFNEADWSVMGTETVAAMDSEGFGNNSYKREQFTIEPTSDFYIAIRVNQTIDAANYRTRWRFDNIKANNQ